MAEPTVGKLIRKLLTLSVLGVGLWFASSVQPVYSVSTCQSCGETYYLDLLECNRQLNSCTLGEFDCWLNNVFCETSALVRRDECYGQCTFNSSGGSGGGGGGSTGKSPCQIACYDQRIECNQNGGTYGTEDCLASGETVPYCCYQVFADCMAGCG